MKKIVIVGGCAAGPKAAAKCRRLNPDNIIEMYSDENVVSYSACGLPYFIGGEVPNINNLIVRSKEEFEKSGINVFLNHACTKIDPENKIVIFNHEKEVKYDELILCMGSYPIKPNVKNLNLENVFNLKVLSDGVKIKQMTEVSKSAVIIGGGYISIELTEAFVKNGLRVTIIERNKNILPLLDEEVSNSVQDEIIKKSGGLVEFALEDEPVEFLGKKKFEGVLTKNGKKINADFCVIAIGVRPNIKIAKEAGIKIGVTGGIKVDKKLRTSAPNIYAAGDCTEDTFIPTKQSVYLALGTIANKQGRIAAINANTDSTGISEQFDGVLGSMVTKFFDFEISATGLSEKKARELMPYINIDPVSVTVEEYDRAGYMPHIGIIKVKLVADRRSGIILGSQVTGTGDADKRIAVIASALRANLTIRDFLDLDLPYAPPFSSTIDPLLTAAYKLKQIIDA